MLRQWRAFSDGQTTAILRFPERSSIGYKSLRKMCQLILTKSKYRSEKGDFGADYKTKSGIKRCEFYNEGFRRNKSAAPKFVDIMPKYRGRIKPNSLAGRLKSGKCEMCGASPVKVYMHHVKRLKDLNTDNEFDELMLRKRWKSLALCPKCYEEAKLKSLKL